MKIQARFLSSKLALATAATLFASSALATPFTSVKIGDEDGFGFNVLATNFSNATYNAVIGGAENGGDAYKLGVGDQLPSLGGGSAVATGNGDDFDNRLGESYSISGGTLSATGMSGVEYTDISLSTSYDVSALPGNANVYDANTNTNGTGGAFPDGSDNLPNQPGFVFDFDVAVGDADSNNDIFFNMLFGDYDVNPASIKFTYGDGSNQSLGVSLQPPGLDGLIQAAFITLDFNKVFTLNGAGTTYEGYVEVDFIANNEPYTAFDFVELSTTAIKTTVPEPGLLLLLGTGLFSLALGRRRYTS